MIRLSLSRILPLGACLVLCTAVSLPAQAQQFQKPEDAVKYRKAAYTVMGAHFGRLNGMAQGKIPFDAKAAADSADVVARMSSLPYAGFGDGTDKGETRAKPEVWKDADKFKAAAAKNQEETGKLLIAAKSGNLDQIKAAVGATGKTCKGCHDDFRKD